jgi:hypothetical protein
VAFLSLPAFVGPGNESHAKCRPVSRGKISSNGSRHQPLRALQPMTGVLRFYPVAYFLLVIAFTYFYTGIVF